MRAITLFFLCCWGAASAQPLQVEVRAMAWSARFAEIGAVTGDWAKGAVQMPYVQSADRPAVAARINEALYLRYMGMPAPLKAGKMFPLADGAEAPASTASQGITVVRNDGQVLSIEINREGCGAYCENYAETASFDARTGRTITLEDVLTTYGRAEIPKRMAAERVRQYREQIKALRANGKKGAADTLDDLELRIALNKGCMQEELQMQATKAWSSVDYLRFGLPAAKSMVFTAGRCSNHALRALDDVGEVSLTLSGQVLARMLTPYGQSLILETASVPEPPNVFEQVLHGKIGSAAVTVFLTSITYDAYGTGERSISGLYFYDKYRKPITLAGKQVGQMISLHEGGDITRAAITLQPVRTGLSGKWEGDNKTLPVTLTGR